jgi:electron transfer flavoprotein alpha subunit
MLAEADVVLSGGKDIGEDGFAVLMALREALEKKYDGRFTVAVGASRAAVDNGCIPYSAQVGLTGKVVHPQVYVAFAIEGAVQHLAGMKDADRIAAVNTDCKAHIFDHADIGVTCDWLETAKALLMKLRAE